MGWLKPFPFVFNVCSGLNGAICAVLYQCGFQILCFYVASGTLVAVVLLRG